MFLSSSDLDPIKAQLARIEEKLDRLLAQGGAPGASVEAPWIQEVRGLVRAGNKIEAIKLYREHTGLGLKESKDAVEALE